MTPAHKILGDHVAELVIALRKERDEAVELATSLILLVGDPGTCKGCGRDIWWVQHRGGRTAPYDGNGVNHFITCSKADLFRRKTK